MGAACGQVAWWFGRAVLVPAKPANLALHFGFETHWLIKPACPTDWIQTLDLFSRILQMFKQLILACLVASAAAVTSAKAETSHNLNGEWIVDAKATEDFVVDAPLPPNADKLAQWFGLAAGYLALFTYEFDGNVVTQSAYRGNRVLAYQRVSELGSEVKYVLKGTSDSKAKTLTVSIQNNGNIRIVPSEAPEMGYLLWKRGQLTTGKVTPEDVTAATNAWLASVQTIVKALRKPLTPSINADATR